MKTTNKLFGIALALICGLPATLKAQNLFVSCPGNNSIVEVSSDGTVSPFASELNDPADLAFNSSGDLFEADEGSGNIYEFINNGGTLNSTPVLYASGLDEPYGLAIGSLGLYVSEYGNGDIVEVSSTGTKTSVASDLAGPEGLVYGVPGVLYVAEQEEGFVTEISIAEGTKTVLATGLNSPSGLAGGGDDDEVIVSNQGGNSIDEIVSKTVETYASSGLDAPSGLALDGLKLYEADSGSGDINVFTSAAGAITESTLATGLDDPRGIAIGPTSLSAPEPSAIALAGLGAAALCLRRRRK